jgi:hypothetical protein
MHNGSARSMRWKPIGLVVLVALLQVGGGCTPPPPVDDAKVSPYAQEGDATAYGIPLSVQNTAQFIGYLKTYPLTPDQEAVKSEALSALEAPCCDDHTMYTCCCDCNLAKSVWGLSNYLIIEKGMGADAVRDAALQWLQFIRPEHYRVRELEAQGVDPQTQGLRHVESCYEGRCELPFSQAGCGGMDELRLE